MHSNKSIHKKLTVIGHVQGVGYRYNCRTIARTLSIKGYVKNQYDGSVYIEAEGQEHRVQQFIRWCYQGPPHAQVNTVTIENGTLVGYKYFDIKG